MPRKVLVQQVARADAMGYGVLAATEFEFITLNETAEKWRTENFFSLDQFAPYNHAAAVRAAAETEEKTRLELRLPGRDMDPYLSLAATPGAGLDGLDRKLELTVPPIMSDGPTEIPEGAERRPIDLLDATKKCRASARARALFGEAFVELYATICEAEDFALRKAVSANEVQRHLEAG